MPLSTPQAGSCSPCKFAILPSFKIPSQLTLLLGSSSALTHPWREKKWGKGKDTKQSYVWCDHWKSWGFLPLLWCLSPFAERRSGQGLSLHPSRQAHNDRNPNSRWHPVSGGTPKAFSSLPNSLQPSPLTKELIPGKHQEKAQSNPALNSHAIIAVALHHFK